MWRDSERGLASALEPRRKLQKLARGEHVGVDAQAANATGELRTIAPGKAGHAGGCEMIEQRPTACASLALEGGKRDGQAVAQDVGAEAVDDDFVVLALGQRNGFDDIVGVQRPALVAATNRRRRWRRFAGASVPAGLRSGHRSLRGSA